MAVAAPKEPPSLKDAATMTAAIFRRGNKAELFGDGSDNRVDEAKELEGKLAALHAVWALPRSGKDLAAAIWRPDQQLAEVVLNRGKLFTHIGFKRGGSLFLHIEEAVFLVDRANLLLFLDQGRHMQRLLSTQECHDLMVGSGVSMQQYLTYCKLQRAGWIVQRHPAHFMLAPDEDHHQVWSNWYSRQVQLPERQDSDAAAATQAAADSAGLQQQQPMWCTAEHGSSGAEVAGGTATLPAKRRKVGGGSVAFGDSDATAAKQQQQPKVATHADGGGKGSWLPPLGAHGTWLSFLPESFTASLPRVAVVPEAAAEAWAEYPQMQPLSGLPNEDIVPHPDVGRCLLHYDVFECKQRFSRKKPGKPAFVIAIHPNSAPPSLDQIAAAELAAGEIQVRHSSYEMGDICFYGFPQVDLADIWE